jgi:hypothetical protein
MAEIEAIVAYLNFKAERDEFTRPKIEEALRNYWLPRARHLGVTSIRAPWGRWQKRPESA